MTMSNALYELALHQDIQDKLREEIKEHCCENDEELKFQDIKGMQYLEKVFKGIFNSSLILTLSNRIYFQLIRYIYDV